MFIQNAVENADEHESKGHYSVALDELRVYYTTISWDNDALFVRKIALRMVGLEERIDNLSAAERKIDDDSFEEYVESVQAYFGSFVSTRNENMEWKTENERISKRARDEISFWLGLYASDEHLDQVRTSPLEGLIADTSFLSDAVSFGAYMLIDDRVVASTSDGFQNAGFIAPSFSVGPAMAGDEVYIVGFDEEGNVLGSDYNNNFIGYARSGGFPPTYIKKLIQRGEYWSFDPNAAVNLLGFLDDYSETISYDESAHEHNNNLPRGILLQTASLLAISRIAEEYALPFTPEKLYEGKLDSPPVDTLFGQAGENLSFFIEDIHPANVVDLNASDAEVREQVRSALRVDSFEL